GMFGPFQRNVVGAKVEAVDPATFFFRCEMQIEIAHAHHLAAERAAAIAVGVRPDVHPQRIEPVGTVVGVGEFLVGMQKMPIIIEPHMDPVIHLLLEVRLCRKQKRAEEHTARADELVFSDHVTNTSTTRTSIMSALQLTDDTTPT